MKIKLGLTVSQRIREFGPYAIVELIGLDLLVSASVETITATLSVLDCIASVAILQQFSHLHKSGLDRAQ